MDITMRSSKEEMATAAVELISDQAQQVAELQQRQAVLWALVGLLTVLVML